MLNSLLLHHREQLMKAAVTHRKLKTRLRVELKKTAWSSYNLSLTSDKMGAVNLLSELLNVRARRLEIYGHNTN